MTDAFERAAERTESEYRRERRKRYVRRRQAGFRIHATAFVAVELLLIAIWALQWQLGGTSHPWFLYGLLGWGVGLAVHYAVTRDHHRDAPAAEDESR